MQLILLEKVENLGALGDIVSVKSGYARNYLLPQGKAKVATDANKAEFEARRAELERLAAEALAAAQARAAGIAEKSVQVAATAGDEGKLFGSVGPAEVAAAVTEQLNVTVEKREVRMPEGAIRQCGEYDIELHLHSDVDVTVQVVVVPE